MPSKTTSYDNYCVETMNFLKYRSSVTFAFPFCREIYVGSLVIGSPSFASSSSTPSWTSFSSKSTHSSNSFALSLLSLCRTIGFFLSNCLTSIGYVFFFFYLETNFFGLGNLSVVGTDGIDSIDTTFGVSA